MLEFLSGVFIILLSIFFLFISSNKEVVLDNDKKKTELIQNMKKEISEVVTSDEIDQKNNLKKELVKVETEVFEGEKNIENNNSEIIKENSKELEEQEKLLKKLQEEKIQKLKIEKENKILEEEKQKKLKEEKDKLLAKKRKLEEENVKIKEEENKKMEFSKDKEAKKQAELEKNAKIKEEKIKKQAELEKKKNEELKNKVEEKNKIASAKYVSGKKINGKTKVFLYKNGKIETKYLYHSISPIKETLNSIIREQKNKLSFINLKSGVLYIPIKGNKDLVRVKESLEKTALFFPEVKKVVFR